MSLTTKINSTLESMVQRAGTAKGLDGVIAVVGKGADAAIAEPHVRDALSGTALGHPIHPLLVAVPIGAFASVSILDFTGQGKTTAAQTMIATGITAAVPAALAGLSDWRYTSGVERRVGFVHAAANSVALSLYGASLLARRKGHGGKLLALAGFSVLGASGYLGGHLAYALGVGVDTNSFANIPTKWTAVADADDIKDDELIAVPLNGSNILLTRVDGKLSALANRCSHRGAPLSDGKIEDGCVVCPWHDSKFRLTDGAIVAGPAVRPQMQFDVKTQAGKVMIRHREVDSDLSTNSDSVS